MAIDSGHCAEATGFSGPRLVAASYTVMQRCGFLLACMFGGSARAEIGKATAQPGEWYWGRTGSGAARFGADRQAAQKRKMDSIEDYQNVLYDDGSIWPLPGTVRIGRRRYQKY
jgi:hypothetical protein